MIKQTHIYAPILQIGKLYTKVRKCENVTENSFEVFRAIKAQIGFLPHGISPVDTIICLLNIEDDYQS